LADNSPPESRPVDRQGCRVAAAMATVAEQAKLRMRAQPGSRAAAGFKPVAAKDLANYQLDGEPLKDIALPTLRAAATRHRLPASTLEQEEVMRMLFAALLAASSADRMLAFETLSDQCAGLLLHGIRREGGLSSHTADALNVLGKPQVVERYRAYGNRWTMPVEQPEPAELERARASLDTKSEATSMGEWLNSLADVLDEPANMRPWYRSKLVMMVLSLAALFILLHLGLLFKALAKVHQTDNTVLGPVLLLPAVGLSASAALALVAVAINKLTG
jgi:hypothetical protein